MDWKGARFWSLCFLVLCPAILGEANPGKKVQDETDESSALQSESKVTFVAKEASQIPELRDDSSSASAQSPSNGRSLPVFQIETPIVIKKIKRGSKLVRKDGKSLKSFNNRNETSDELNIQQSKTTTVSVPVALTRDPSVPEESKRIEDVRRNHDILRISDHNKRNDERNFAPAQFIPSENFPKNSHSQTRQASKTSGSIPIGNGEIKYVLSIQPGSSEENSRSDASTEQFDSKRRRDPSSNFNGHQYSTDLPDNQFQGSYNSNHQNNAFAQPEAQRVTIVKEKSVQSSSREEAQERVNIEKNPLHKESTNEVILEQHPRTFHSPQNIGVHGLNNQEERVLLIEGTHIPGRNYGPEDDTFGFYTDSYKEDKPSEHPNRKRVKVVKVVKTRGDERVPADIPLNNHGDGQSRQYFLSEQQNIRNNKGINQQPSGKHFSGDGNRVHLAQGPQIRQNEENHFIPIQINENVKQTGHNSVPQNINFDAISPKNTLLSSGGSGNKLTSQRANTEHVILNLNPDPNQLYIDENTGQLIKFVIAEDSSQQSYPNVAERTFNNQKSSEGLFPQRYEEPQRNAVGHLQQKGSNQLQNHNAANFLRGPNSNSYSSASGLNDQRNIQEGVKYIQVSNGDAIHIINNDAGNDNEKQVYYLPQDQTSGNQYVQSQGIAHSNQDDDSEEYVIVCDQEGEDYSGEYQSGDLGSVNPNIHNNNRQQPNFHSQNQLQSSGYPINAGINHNKGHPNLNNQGKNSGYDTSSENSNFLKQNFGSRLPNQEHNQQKSIGNSQGSIYLINQQKNFKGANFDNSNNKGGANYATSQIGGGGQGHYKGSAFSDDGVTNFATPATNIGAQGHYKGSEFSNNKGDLNFGTPKITVVAQGHSKGSEFPQRGLDIGNLQINAGGQGNYKGNQLSNNKGSVDFGSQHINTGPQSHFKGSRFSNNKGASNFPQDLNAGVQDHYKGSEFPNNKGAINFVTLKVDSGAQGHHKGTEFPSNKGAQNFVTPQINSGAQGHYKGSEFSNNKGSSNFATLQVNSGAQGHYKGSEYPNNKGSSNFATPQITSGAQGHYKGSELPNNKGSSNFATLQGNSGAQGHYKGSDYPNNKGSSNFANLQVNSGAQGQFKGTEFSNNKGDSNYETQQIHIEPQGHYKGTQFSNNKQNSKVPVYREVVTPAYPVDDFASVKGNNKGTNFQLQQNEGNFNQGIKGISSGNYNKGQVQSNQKGYGNNNAFSNTKGNSGYNRGSELHNQNQYIDNDAFSNSQNYGGDANLFSGAIVTLDDSKVKEFQNGKNYDSGTDGLTGIILSSALNKGSEFPTQQGYNSGNSNNKGYDLSQEDFSSNKGNNKGSFISNQKGYNGPQGINKGSELYPAKGYEGGNEFHANQGFVNQKGIAGNNGQGQKSDSGENNYDQALFLNQHAINSGINNQKGYSKGNDLFSANIPSKGQPNRPHLSSQGGYISSKDVFSSNTGYNPEGQFIDSLSLKGDQGDLALLIKNGYNAGNELFLSNKGNPFSSDGPSKGFNEGPVFPIKKDFNSGSNHGQSGNKGYNSGARIELFSDVISSKGLNKGSGSSNNKGFNSGNNGYKTTVSESYSGSFSPQSPNKGSNHRVQTGYDSGSNAFSGNKGYNAQSNSFPSNKGYEKGSNVFIENNRNNFKGTPAKTPPSNDYGRHLNSVPAIENNYKGSNSGKNTGNSGYGNQQAVGYGDESLKGALQGQQYNPGNDQYGVSYSSSEENAQHPLDQQYSGKQEPVQYILVEEDIPGAKNGNEEAVYYLQHDGGSDQEKTYLIVDDPSLQQHQNLRVMVDGGKDRTYPIRQLATVGLHMARTVIPQIRNTKAKSIKGKISFGVEIKKGAGQSDDSQHYLESRIDKENKKAPQDRLKQKFLK